MIGIAQDNIGFDIVFKFPLVHPFDGSGRPDRHKNGRLDGPVVGGDGSGARLRMSVGSRKFKSHACALRKDTISGGFPGFAQLLIILEKSFPLCVPQSRGMFIFVQIIDYGRFATPPSYGSTNTA